MLQTCLMTNDLCRDCCRRFPHDGCAPIRSFLLLSAASAITAAYRQDEAQNVGALMTRVHWPLSSRSQAQARARKLIAAVRGKRARSFGVDALMHEFSLSCQEGIALMCLAEALLRIPDADTADRLIRDKISRGDWGAHLGSSPSLFVNAAAWGLLITGKLCRPAARDGLTTALARLIAQRRRAADPQGRGPGDAHAGPAVRHRPRRSTRRSSAPRARSARLPLFVRHAGRGGADRGRRRRAITPPTRTRSTRSAGERPGAASTRARHLGQASALHPRYARAQRERVMAELLPRLSRWRCSRSATTSASTSMPRKRTGWSFRSICWKRSRSTRRWLAGTASASSCRPTRSAARS